MKGFPKSVPEGTMCSDGRVFNHNQPYSDCLEYELELFVNKCGIKTFHGNFLSSSDGLNSAANGRNGRYR